MQSKNRSNTFENSRICMINQMAPAYRKAIYQLMDSEMNIDWYFGEKVDDIKEMDIGLLNKVSRFSTKRLIGPLYWQCGTARLLYNPKYDTFLLHGEAFNLSTWAILLLNKFRIKKKKIFIWSHGWYGREGFWKKWLKKIFFGLADKTFVYGDYAKRQAVLQGNNPRKIEVIHNSLDHSEQIILRKRLMEESNRKRTDVTNLVFIGRLTSVKRLDILLKAMNILKMRGGKYKLYLIGDGKEGNRLKEMATSLGLEVEFVGECFDEEIIGRYLYNSDICISPGNVGLTAMHALVYGTPVITHNNFVYQMPEFEAIVKGKTGDFYKYNSAKSLANTISEWVIKHHDDREIVRQNCFQEIDTNWTPEFQIKILKNNIL